MAASGNQRWQQEIRALSWDWENSEVVIIYPDKCRIACCHGWFQEGTNLVGGWPTPLKNDGVSNSWDDDIPNIWENKKMFQTTNQRCYLGMGHKSKLLDL